MPRHGPGTPRRPAAGPTWPGSRPRRRRLREHDVSRAAQQLDLAPDELRGWEWAQLRACLDDGLGPLAEGLRWLNLIGFRDDGRRALLGAGAIEIRDPPFAEVSVRIPVRSEKVYRAGTCPRPARSDSSSPSPAIVSALSIAPGDAPAHPSSN